MAECCESSLTLRNGIYPPDFSRRGLFIIIYHTMRNMLIFLCLFQTLFFVNFGGRTLQMRGLDCNMPQARQMGDVHTACQATGDLHNVKKDIFVFVYQNIPPLYRILKTCSFIQTTMSNLCSDEQYWILNSCTTQ